MTLPLKYILIGGVAGTAAIAAPVVITQMPKSTYNYKVANNVVCHWKKNYGLLVDDEVVTWAPDRESLERENRDEKSGKGKIVEGDKSLCYGDSTKES